MLSTVTHPGGNVMTEEHSPTAVGIERCDLCIVGAGLAGINALFAATRHLTRDQRVILLDRRPRAGGMWVDTYPYVRLHQPHPMFTAGNIAWTLGRERSYLAKKDEVLAHFGHCLDVLRQKVRVDTFFGWEMLSDEETHGGVEITCRSAAGKPMRITAARLIKAHGFAVLPNDALPVSSSQVHSVSPDECDVRSGAMHESTDPVWVIGGGKTAMDTAHALISSRPGREVNLVAGAGTYFGRRDLFFPTGARRWWSGATVAQVGADICRRFDGTNEQDVFAWFRDRYGTWVTPQTGRYLLGLLSDSERDAIAAGVGERVMDHFVDVADRDGTPELILRSGQRRTLTPGSWIVNCTGYIARDDVPYEPFASASGRILSIQIRSAAMHFSSYAGYFLTHLMYRDRLREAGLYELDLLEMRRRAPAALPFAMFTLALHNLSLAADQLPGRVFSECGLDMDRWYPLPRRAYGTARFLATHRRRRERQREALDNLRDRFGIRCGPLVAA